MSKILLLKAAIAVCLVALPFACPVVPAVLIWASLPLLIFGPLWPAPAPRRTPKQRPTSALCTGTSDGCSERRWTVDPCNPSSSARHRTSVARATQTNAASFTEWDVSGLPATTPMDGGATGRTGPACRRLFEAPAPPPPPWDTGVTFPVPCPTPQPTPRLLMQAPDTGPLPPPAPAEHPTGRISDVWFFKAMENVETEARRAIVYAQLESLGALTQAAARHRRHPTADDGPEPISALCRTPTPLGSSCSSRRNSLALSPGQRAINSARYSPYGKNLTVPVATPGSGNPRRAQLDIAVRVILSDAEATTRQALKSKKEAEEAAALAEQVALRKEVKLVQQWAESIRSSTMEQEAAERGGLVALFVGLRQSAAAQASDHLAHVVPHLARCAAASQMEERIHSLGSQWQLSRGQEELLEGLARLILNSAERQTRAAMLTNAHAEMTLWNAAMRERQLLMEMEGLERRRLGEVEIFERRSIQDGPAPMACSY